MKIDNLNRTIGKLLAACQWVYCKYYLKDKTLERDEVGNSLLDAMRHVMGDNEFESWLYDMKTFNQDSKWQNSTQMSESMKITSNEIRPLSEKDTLLHFKKNFGIDLSKFESIINKKYRLEKDLNKEVKKLWPLFGKDLQATRKEQGQYCSCAGIHDWLLCWKGAAGSVELKSAKGTPSPLQKKWGREAEAAGRVIGYAWTIGDVFTVIKKLEAKKISGDN